MKTTTTHGHGFQPHRLSCLSILFALLLCSPWAASAQGDAFITTWKTDVFASFVTSVTIPTTGGGYNYEVDWNNDGTYDQSGLTGDVTHDFFIPGTYTIRIRGSFPRIYFNDNGDNQKLLDIKQWGTIAWTSMARAFHGCSNLTNISATDVPDLSAVTDMSYMFIRCAQLNGPSNIGNWNTAAVTNMEGIFYEAKKFNQPIGNWNTAKVTNMRAMFYDASKFNQPIGNWNTANVTNMGAMFGGAYDFDQPISNWNTAKVNDMGLMFSRASSFNQPISNWNTATVTDVEYMFSQATSFNQPIGNWNTANVTNMGWMFSGASLFNQPIDNWNTAKVTNMRGMFAYASNFNQPIGNWTLNASVNMTQMLDSCGMDCHNYSATLLGWSNNPATPSGRSLGASGIKYGTNAEAARNTLIANKGWTITGDAASGADCMLVSDAEPHALHELTVQPNPFSERAIISLSSDHTGKGRLWITDVSGHVFMEKTLVATPATTTLDWDTATVPPGVYFVRFESEGGAVVRKVVRM